MTSTANVIPQTDVDSEAFVLSFIQQYRANSSKASSNTSSSAISQFQFDLPSVQSSAKGAKKVYDANEGLESEGLHGRGIVNVLRNLSMIVFENGAKLSQYHDPLLSLLLPLLSTQSSNNLPYTDVNFKNTMDFPPEITRMVVNTLGNLCYRSGPKVSEQNYHKMMNVVKTVMIERVDSYVKGTASVEEKRTLSSCLRSLQIILAEDKSAFVILEDSQDPYSTSNVASKSKSKPSMIRIDADSITAIVDSLYWCLFRKTGETWVSGTFRLPSHSSVLPTTPFRQSTSSQRTSNTMLSSTDPYIADSLKKIRISTSDSEVSDIESSRRHRAPPSHSESVSSQGETKSKGTRNEDHKIKINALNLLLTMARVTGKHLYSHWQKLLASSSTSSASTSVLSQPSLLSLIHSDPHHKIRASGLVCIAAMLDGAKGYLGIAEDRVSLSPRSNDTEKTGKGKKSKGQSSFTSLSERLGELVRDCHSEICAVLKDEGVTSVLYEGLKCVKVLVNNCSYERLPQGYLTKLYESCTPLLNHSDSSIRSLALSSVASIVDVEAGISQLSSVLLLPNVSPPNPSKSQDPGKVDLMTFLTLSLRAHTEENEGPEKEEISNVVVESYGLLSVIARRHVRTVWQHWDRIERVLSAHLLSIPSSSSTRHPHRASESDHLIRLSAIKFLNESIKSLSTYITASLSAPVNSPTMTPEAPSTTLSIVNHITITHVVQWWIAVLDKYITCLTNSDNKDSVVKSVAIDCLSDMTEFVAGEVDIRRRLFCMTLLLALAAGENPEQDLDATSVMAKEKDVDVGTASVVRSAACRTLGILVGWKWLRDDSQYLSDAATTLISACSDSTLTVRVRASWALANLCDTLVLICCGEKLLEGEDPYGQHINTEVSTPEAERVQSGIETMDRGAGKKNSENGLPEGIPAELILKIMKTGVMMAKDNDKCRVNGARILGSIIRVSNSDVLSAERGKLLEESVQLLLKNVKSGSLKTRWNACHAITNFLHNPVLPLSTCGWTIGLYETLTSILSHKNYKVRIHAVKALSVPSRRQDYVNANVWKNVVVGILEMMEKLENEQVDFNEGRYKAQLKECGISALNKLVVVGIGSTPGDDDGNIDGGGEGVSKRNEVGSLKLNAVVEQVLKMIVNSEDESVRCTVPERIRQSL
ncbi:hypothetical protein BKA69DRAFT_1117689 [Paraphysoderma sedebokerense]|nr:hypothetical protein BKA69DRAFT_1117689 [Paraphysoderma sedebokerense]